ncbi:hypothetical protein A2160_00620 [Candidatus Beckwithbacteria bacterium RBG_13_42_9]|uniref:Uncharacterized protein n=1 Tax=Candidatus Beckwithbacteria bacterium RBG_13_42_9 TaxID=1797457 RepID=A0A1F5E4J3_9BACT|nr:MAG: hypothetical protein A2160_00620 [Candidatus Beckwithbacteria bacterium RBG_13_42_9]
MLIALLSLALLLGSLLTPKSASAQHAECPSGYHPCQCIAPGLVGKVLPPMDRLLKKFPACCHEVVGVGVCIGAKYFENKDWDIPLDPDLKDFAPLAPVVVTVKPIACEGSTVDNPIIETAIGCIPATPQGFIGKFLEIAIFIGGGIAFLIMSWGAFLLITSQGNPEQIKNGQDTFVSAGAGLLFIIFAVFILRLIGVDILKIPGFV